MKLTMVIFCLAFKRFTYTYTSSKHDWLLHQVQGIVVYILLDISIFLVSYEKVEAGDEEEEEDGDGDG